MQSAGGDKYAGGMPVNITIRDVPGDVHDELAARAARGGRSLQEYLKGQLTDLAHRPLAVDVVAELRRHAATRQTMDVDSLVEDVAAERR